MATTTPPAGAAPHKIVTSDSAGGGPKLSRRQRLYGAVAVAVLVVAGLGAYLLTHQTNPDAANLTKNPPETKAQVISDQVQDLKGTGKYDDAQKLLDGQLAAAQSAAEKSDLYVQKSSVANNAGDFTTALDYAQQAEKLQPTSSSAYMIAIAAEGLGNKSLAVTYYQKTLDRLTPEQKKRAPDLAET
jgi:tetratricopeptide (TPR) repeat protein